jgi:hypothetical protein
MTIKYLRLHIKGDAVVVAFDICSSSDIIEELTLKGDMQRLQNFLIEIKRYLMKEQETIPFDAYKFTGDGWILLFPANTDGKALLTFLQNLCKYFQKKFRNDVLRFLDTPPTINGISFGVEKGPLTSFIMYGRMEYVGRGLNIACRLQNTIKVKDKSPAYKALVSNAVYNDYFSPARNYKVQRVKRTLRNIRGGKDFWCIKIDLLSKSTSR